LGAQITNLCRPAGPIRRQGGWRNFVFDKIAAYGGVFALVGSAMAKGKVGALRYALSIAEVVKFIAAEACIFTAGFTGAPA
jgi:hypothetical protein